MNTPRYATAAAKLIGKYLPAASTAAGDQARGIATIERALRARARRRRLFAVGGAVAAAAALVLAAQLLKPKPTQAVSIDASALGKGAAIGQGVGEHPLGAHAAMEPGQHIETPVEGGASLRLSTGTSIDLGGHTSFRVDSQGAVQRFSLHTGQLSAQVAKLASLQRFIVDTPDAEVEVRGTRFLLRVLEQAEQCGAGTRTRLEVTEGVVEVRAAGIGAVDVKAGQSWPADCGNAPVPGAAPALERAASSSTAASAPKHEPLQRGSASANDDSASERESALAAPNDLFAEGVARRRQGDISGALRAYRTLLRRFPNSPLAENALVERMRLLTGSAEARVEANRYLARYPQGFAVTEAQRVVTQP